MFLNFHKFFYYHSLLYYTLLFHLIMTSQNILPHTHIYGGFVWWIKLCFHPLVSMNNALQKIIVYNFLNRNEYIWYYIFVWTLMYKIFWFMNFLFFSINLDNFSKRQEINTPKQQFLKCLISSILVLMLWGLLHNFYLTTKRILCVNVCQSVSRSLCPSTCPSVRPSVCLSINQSVSQSVRPSVMSVQRLK